MGQSTRVMETLNLWSAPTAFWLETQNKSLPVLCISRDEKPAVSISDQASIPSIAVRRSIHGVLGIIELPLGTSLVTISRKKKVGEVEGHVIYRLEAVEFVPISSRSPSASAELDAHRRCQNLLQTALSTPYFYFSYTGDLTNSYQRRSLKSSQESSSSSSWDGADSRFLWNFHLVNTMSSLMNNKLDVSPFVIQLVHGAAFIQRCSINGKSFVWAIVTRRSRFQTGTRFFARGSDKHGNVANFCETEQIVEYDGQVASFVQTRGSMPFFWSQIPCIKYMPRPTILGNETDSQMAMKAHFDEQTGLYGKQVIINLINQKKYEGTLETAFSKFVNSLKMPDVHYVAFDFHKECSKMRYDRLILLKDQLSSFEMDFFHKKGSQVFLNQKGVLRTNCMDCLDRTNVVQAYMAADTLAKILSSWGILTTDSVSELEKNETFLKIYRNCWADHADLISIQYAGTGALKTDFTRTGVRSHWGVLQDGWNSAIRYVKNNFRDGNRTDSVKFLLGELSPKDVESAETIRRQRLQESEQNIMSHLPQLMLALVIALALVLLAFPRLSFFMLILVLLIPALMYVLFQQMIAHSNEFVDYPTSYILSRKR